MAKTFAMVFGWIFIVLGVLGFFPNPLISAASDAWFMADTSHNLVHLISGIIFLWVAYGASHKASAVLKVFGVIYLLVALVGFFTSSSTVLGLFMVNSADNWLHLVFAAFFLWGGFSKNPSSMGMQGM